MFIPLLSIYIITFFIIKIKNRPPAGDASWYHPGGGSVIVMYSLKTHAPKDIFCLYAMMSGAFLGTTVSLPSLKAGVLL